ncbi:MAG: hypothetical protein PUF50_03490 [Erysipelotrichaceae bacterium]|nr:hypothetical protein [Erysipelotrichaceae bacterium]
MNKNLENDPDEIYTVIVKNNEYELHHIFDWDFGIDTHFLEELIDGYEIYHMPVIEHAGVWSMIDELRDDLHCAKGIQLYLEYCQKNSITPQIHGRNIDITDLYIETNIGYNIIANVDILSASVVLGRKQSYLDQYVTWYTTPTRKNGYVMGHYFNSFEAAYEDFTQRAKDLFNTHLEAKKYWIRPLKEREIYER